MIETQSNGDSISKEVAAPVRLRLNHPKLHALHFLLSPAMPFHLARKELTRENMLSLFNNFHFEVDDLPIRNERDYNQLIKSHPLKEIQLQIVFEHFKHATALYHFKAVRQLLNNPHRLATIFKTNQKSDSKWSNELDIELLTSEVVPEAFRGHKWDIDQVILPSYKGELHQGREEKVELIQFLEFSGFNPPPPQAQFAGDFFYLHLKTLENLDLHITACANGFYVNQSKINCYNPAIQNGKPTYTSLLDLLVASSEKFSNLLNRLTDANPPSLLERIWRKSSTIISNQSLQLSKWLDNYENEHHWNSRKDLSLRDLENNPADHRDWNQEFVELSRMSEKVSAVGEEGDRWSAQAYRELYAEFTAAAIDAARRIVEGKVRAINHMDEEKRHIYIFNKIFMSATTETPYDHKVSKEDELLPSSTSVSADILNLERLSALKPKGLRLLQTLLISYRGWRMLVQTIIPGLLTSELNSITLYGALDDSKSIQADETFRGLLLPLCKELHLQENVLAIEKSQAVVNIAVSPEIKGIKSTSGEYFLCDLQKFSPRDLNYTGLQNEGCILRPKLVNQYIQDNHIDFSVTAAINPNIGTDIKFVPGPRHEQQEAFLLNAARYLKETAVSKLINALKSKNPGDFLTDSSGISSIFHEFGVNMRYLGFVLRHENVKQNVQVKICLTRVILVRCLKHLFRSILRNSDSLHIAAVSSHVLNCIFGKKSALQQLSAVEEVEERVEASESKRKKKKKNRQEEKEVKVVVQDENRSIKAEPCKYLAMKPQDIWEEVNKLAKSRFDYSFEPTILAFHQKGLFRLTYQKYAALRDLCLCIGMVLQRKDYNLSQSDTSDSLPFTPRNILYFNAISKTITLSPSEELKNLKIEADRLFSLNQIKQALAAYNQIVRLIRERKEGECLLSYCLGQISRLEYMNCNLREAISVETENLVFSQRTGREDSLEVIRCYSRLGLYCMGLGAKELSLWLLYKGLHLMLMSFGEAYPDILINFANVARVHQQNRETALTASCYLKAIDLLTQVYGKNHINISFCYSSLASLHYELGDYKKSADYQGETVAILQKVLSADDNKYQDAVKIHKMYREYLQSKGGMASRPNEHNSGRKK